MNGDRQTVRGASPAFMMVAAVALVGLIGWAIFHLERDRSRKQIAQDIKLWRIDDGAIHGAQFVTPDVTQDHWALIEAAADTLRSINLSNTEKVAGGLAPLRKFPNLRVLHLAGCRWANDFELARIAKQHRLHLLDVTGTRITDRGLRELDLSELRQLIARNCPGLTDKTFAMLSELPSLNILSLPDVSVAFDEYERLRTSRPEMVIVVSPELTWEIVDRPDLLRQGVNWLTDETDVDQFVRYWNLRHDWPTGDNSAPAGSGPSDGFRRLILGGPGVSRALPGILAGITDLTSLTILDTKLDGGLSKIPPNVTSLSLMQLHAGSDLGDMNAISRLAAVHTRDVDFTPEQWRDFFTLISANESCDMLLLSGAELPAGIFQELAEHPALRHLGLIECQVTDADLQAIGQIKSLEILDVARIPISDAVAQSWLDLPKLTYLDTQGGEVGPVAAEQLRQRYPKANLHIR